LIDLASVEKHLTTKVIGHPQGWKNELWDEIDSTNSRAITLAAEGAPEGLVVLARQQNAGRGRLGRTWVSPPDSGIYLSVVLRPNLLPTQITLITLGCGSAVANAIQKSIGIKIGLKWVNDLVYNGRKLGGILAEMPSSTSDRKPVILGIGINIQLNEDDIPEDLQTKIEWLERITENPVDYNLLIANVLIELERMYENLCLGQSHKIIDSWTSFSVTLGQQVLAEIGSKSLNGKAIALTPDGALVIETDDGQKNTLPAGEITIRSPAGAYY
jgi:BirA family biotin operon repressor/biotin-[acetyl-CoA-carboxylase] ligase